jgi:hypothetical protein
MRRDPAAGLRQRRSRVKQGTGEDEQESKLRGSPHDKSSLQTVEATSRLAEANQEL